MALNTAIVFLRSEKKKEKLIQRSETLENLKIKNDEVSDDEHRLKIMYQAINQLNPIDKALIFYYLEDYSGKEMAVQLGLTEGNTRVKLNRAKNRLMELVKALEKEY